MQTLSKQHSKEIRKRIIKMHTTGTGVGSSLSIVDILCALYFDIMHIKSPDDPKRDRFVLSKGHAASALYATLAQKGFIDESLIDDYFKEGGLFTSHPIVHKLPGIEASTGSLGHGFPIALGMALAAKKDNLTHHVYTLLGDGECQEGSVWESAMIASRLGLNNITAIIDVNDCQGYDRVDKILPLESLKDKWASFGWHAVEVDGHNPKALIKAFNDTKDTPKPSVLIARTIMGKGVREMEDKLEWHYYSVPSEKVKPFIEEIEQDL